MKLKLDTEGMNEDFFLGTRLLGITAPLKSFQFCLLLNQQLGYRFRLNSDFEIPMRRKERTYYFSVYESKEPNTSLVHYLYHNHYDGEYLLPEFRHMDFLWLMKGDTASDVAVSWIKQVVKSIPEVQMIVELPIDQVKNKGNMIL